MLVPNSTGTRLVLAAQQTVGRAQASHDALLQALAGTDRLVVDCAAVTEADLSLIQLLLAARASAERLGKSVVVVGAASGGLRQALDDFGSGDDAFWRGEA